MSIGESKSKDVAIDREPMPHGKGVNVFDLIREDLTSRENYGIKEYGEPLTTFNGRDALVDAYQELLDLVVYLRQFLEERDKWRKIELREWYGSEDGFESEPE